MRQSIVRDWQLQIIDKGLITFVSPLLKHHFYVNVEDATTCRVIHTLSHHATPTFKATDVPVETSHDEKQYTITLQTSKLRIVVVYKPTLRLSWHRLDETDAFLEDLLDRAYAFDRKDGSMYHYITRKTSDGEICYGLGETSGSIIKDDRRFRLEGSDSLGYSAEWTDPLYKLQPFYITLNQRLKSLHGIYYNNLANGSYDFGAEIDIIWGRYRTYHSSSGPLEYYVFQADSFPEMLTSVQNVLLRPTTLPPLYSFGYLASAMGYAEQDDAQDAIARFPDECRKHSIPCDGLHLSSGYTVDEATGNRCVFNWNTTRFPDPKKLFADLKQNHGIHVFANIKPWLLGSHPQYPQLLKPKGLVWDDEIDRPSVTYLWSAGLAAREEGSYVDFTSRAGFEWWYENVKKQVLEYGLEGIWNDNNEYNGIADDEHSFAMDKNSRSIQDVVPGTNKLQFGRKQNVGDVGRMLQTFLMAQCSYAALTDFAPNRRPFLITRSSTPGVHRFASQTWSGDNYTAWSTLKHNLSMTVGAGLSYLPGGYGHDIGGFGGPKPEAELLVRWVQNGIFHSRFSIHSWNDDGSVTEPWTYPEHVAAIRYAIKFRYRLLPMLYALHIQYIRKGWPVVRPMFWHVPLSTYENKSKSADQDGLMGSIPRLLRDSTQVMLGNDILFAPVMEKGQFTKEVFLPREVSRWWCGWFTGTWHDADKTETLVLDAPLNRYGPMLIRSGGVVVLGGDCERNVGDGKGERTAYIYPSPHGTGEGSFNIIEDDGYSNDHTSHGIYTELKVWFKFDESTIEVGIETIHAKYKLPYKHVSFVAPAGEKRPIRHRQQTSTKSILVEV